MTGDEIKITLFDPIFEMNHELFTTSGKFDLSGDISMASDSAATAGRRRHHEHQDHHVHVHGHGGSMTYSHDQFRHDHHTSMHDTHNGFTYSGKTCVHFIYCILYVHLCYKIVVTTP